MAYTTPTTQVRVCTGTCWQGHHPETAERASSGLVSATCGIATQRQLPHTRHENVWQTHTCMHKVSTESALSESANRDRFPYLLHGRQYCHQLPPQSAAAAAPCQQPSHQSRQTPGLEMLLPDHDWSAWYVRAHRPQHMASKTCSHKSSENEWGRHVRHCFSADRSCWQQHCVRYRQCGSGLAELTSPPHILKRGQQKAVQEGRRGSLLVT